MAVPFILQPGETASSSQFNANWAACIAAVGALPSNSNLSGLTYYNYGFYTDNTSIANNDTGLTNMFGAMAGNNAGNGGGYGMFAAANFPVNANGFTVPDQATFQGAGCNMGNGSNQGTFAIQTAGTFLNCTGAHTFGGVNFIDIGFGFTQGGNISSSSVAISVSSLTNTRAIRCTFLDCPTAFNASGLSSGLFMSTVSYQTTNVTWGSNTAATAQPCVRLSAAETFAVGPGEYLQQPVNSNGAVNMAGISVEGDCDHGVVSSLHISDFDYGITYVLKQRSSSHCQFDALKIDANVCCVYMQLNSNSNAHVFNQKYVNCNFRLTDASSNTFSMVFLDTNGNTFNQLDDIEFHNCTVYQGLGHGYEFKTGQNAKVIGGTSSGNSTTGAGVAVTGAWAGTLQVCDMNLQPSYANATNVRSQLYAFAIAANAGVTGQITVSDCDMSGYSGAPVNIGASAFGTGGKLRIDRCLGYNDQNTIVTSSAPGATTSAQAHGYYGTSIVGGIVTTSGSFTLNGTAFALGAGTVFPPITVGPYDTVATTGTWGTWYWKGVWA